MQAFLHLVDSTAIMTALAMAYGATMRFGLAKRWSQVALGAAFGVGAALSMLQPIFQFGQVIIDCRILFAGFAGAFLGLRGALVMLAVASLGRLAINVSPAAFSGILGMAVALAAGQAWQRIEHLLQREWARLVLLGVMISLSYLLLLLVPELRGSHFPVDSVAILIAYNIFGAVVLGAFLHREMAQASREAAALTEAATDPLTGVLNRRGFATGFDRAERRSGSKGSALLMIDLDHFKAVNDTHGHGAGDEVLRKTGRCIQDVVRPGDLVLRAGGEEFGVLLCDIDEAGARAFAERIRRSLAQPFQLSDATTIVVTASIGGVCWTTGSTSQGRAAGLADIALYRAKTGGRDRTEFHLPIAS